MHIYSDVMSTLVQWDLLLGKYIWDWGPSYLSFLKKYLSHLGSNLVQSKNEIVLLMVHDCYLGCVMAPQGPFLKS